jgi:hypothetical protein
MFRYMSKLKPLLLSMKHIWTNISLRGPECPICGGELFLEARCGDTWWCCTGVCGQFFGPNWTPTVDGERRAPLESDLIHTSHEAFDFEDDETSGRRVQALLISSAASALSLVLIFGLTFWLMSPTIKALSATKIFI